MPTLRIVSATVRALWFGTTYEANPFCKLIWKNYDIYLFTLSIIGHMPTISIPFLSIKGQPTKCTCYVDLVNAEPGLPLAQISPYLHHLPNIIIYSNPVKTFFNRFTNSMSS